MELLNAADGGAAAKGRKGGRVERRGTWSTSRREWPVDLNALHQEDPKTRDVLHAALTNEASEASYVLPPQMSLLVVSRASPALFEAAELASVRIQRFFRSWRVRGKFTRLEREIRAQRA